MTDETSEARLRSDARRNRRTVLDAAVALLARRPQATMQEVADASGLGRTTVYRHFPRRQDLVDALYEEVLRESGETVREAIEQADGARDLLCDLGARVIAIGERYRFLDAHPELRERTLSGEGDQEGSDPLSSYLAAAQARGELRDDLPVSWMLTAMRGLAVVAMVEVSAGTISVEEAGRHVGETCASAFAPQHELSGRHVPPGPPFG
jgi:AcrR family transcriptional regulator